MHEMQSRSADVIAAFEAKATASSFAGVQPRQVGFHRELGRIAMRSQEFPDARMTVAEFVSSRFIPEYLLNQPIARRISVRSILKHVLRSEMVYRQRLHDRSRGDCQLNPQPGWPYLDHIRLCEVTAFQIQELLSAVAARGYSAQTVMHVRSVISSIFSYAEKVDCFSGDNPSLRLPLPKLVRTRSQVLSADQVEEVLLRLKYPGREIAMLSLCMGMTISEICGLQWKNIRFTSHRTVSGIVIVSGAIHLEKQWAQKGLVDVPMNRRTTHLIPTPLAIELKALQDRSQGIAPEDFVVADDAGMPLSRTSVLRIGLKSIGRELGIPWLSWQALRRSVQRLSLHTAGKIAEQFIETPVLEARPVQACSRFL